MKLMRIGAPGAERPIVRLDEHIYVDVSDDVGDFDEGFFATTGIASLHEIVEERVESGRIARFAGERIGPPIARPHQIIGIGLNFADHVTETGAEVPAEPLIFSKSPNSICGPDDDVLIPPDARKTDWEVELGIVIGRPALYLASEAEAAASIAGYVLVDDVSDRGFQIERSGQFMKGKSAPTFCPTGPWLATPDEISDLLDLRMTCDVNGVRRQDGSTSGMIFTPAFLVHYLSQFLRLEPGDLITTGTPAGVGLGMTPPRYLEPGDVMTLSIDALGTQRHRLLATAPAGGKR
jgi:2,4-diketo-3-deoxy-L-fuconate hydrolase